MRIVRSLHAWCGVALSLFLVAIGLTGAVSVLRGEIVRATTPAARAAPAPSSTFGPALDRYEAAGGAPIGSVKFAPYDLGVHRLYLDGGAGAFVAADGTVAARWSRNGRFEDLVLSLHHEFLAGEAGGRAVGVIGLAGLGLVLSGLVIWALPRPRPGFGIWPGSGRRGDVLRAHWGLGVVLAAFLLVQFATGASMALGEVVRPLANAARPPPPQVASYSGPRDWTRALAAAQALYPDARLRRASAPRAPDAPFAVHLQRPGDWNPEGGTVVYVDGHGVTAGTIDTAREGVGARLYNALLGVHSGAFGGGGTRLVIGLLGLGLAALGGYGAWAFLTGPRLRRRSAAQASRAG